MHLLNGLYDAKCDGQPVLAITGHTFHDLIGTHYQQDVDLDKLFMDVAAYNQRVMGPAHVVNVVDEAIKTALALPHGRAYHHPEGHPGLDSVERGTVHRQHCRSTVRICTPPRGHPLPPQAHCKRPPI